MRHIVSALCAVLAALLAAASLAGAQVDQLLRDEEPVRAIAGDLPEQDGFSDAVTAVLIEELTGGDADALPSGVAEPFSGVASSLLRDDRTVDAWDESLQNTREDFAHQLEVLFHEGGSGTPEDLRVSLDLSPVTEAMAEPLRDSLDSLLGWLPIVDDSTFDDLAPEVVIDVDAVAEDGVDPYQWATVAEVSGHWQVLAGLAGALGLVSLLLGVGSGRWVSLTLGGIIAAGVGTWVALTLASPDLSPAQPVPGAAGAILEHAEEQFSAWAQPSWWIFVVCAAAVVLIGLLGAALTGGGRARSPRNSGQRPLRSSVGHDDLHRV